MSRRVRKKAARPISNRRDFDGASAVAKRMSGGSELGSKAEARLQALLRELDKFDEAAEDAADDPESDYDSSGPRRRWSDDAADE